MSGMRRKFSIHGRTFLISKKPKMRPRRKFIFWVIISIGFLLGNVNCAKKKAVPNDVPKVEHQQEQQSLSSPQSDLELILASTLDGTLAALDAETGKVLWKVNDEPVVKSPYDREKPVLPAFLPDPRDGSIYMIVGGGVNKEPLKKLPFTIPELVAASPCKSSDGILYTGKKVDTWFAIDRITGERKGSVSSSGCPNVMDNFMGQGQQCPSLNKPANFLIGRTEYNIMMFDSRDGGKKWNISFYDYSANLGNAASDVGPEYGIINHFEIYGQSY